MQKICIRNNGPVKDFEMEVEKFNLLIGEQATGKSTIAKSVYFFRTIKTKITDYMTQIYDFNSYNNKPQDHAWFDRTLNPELKNIFIKLFGYSWDLNPDFYMRYDFESDLWIVVELKIGVRGKRYISVEYSPRLLGLLRDLQKEIRHMYSDNMGTVKTSLVLTNEERKRNHGMIADRVNAVFCDSRETYFIPAGRSLLTVMANNRALMNQAGDLDLITEMFMTLIDSVRNSFRDGVKKAHLYYPVANRSFEVHAVADLMVDMEKGEYFYSGGREFLRIEEDTEHPLAINFTSSGQQEILWMLNFMYILMLRQEKVFLIIEEPEAHIYPLLQKKIVEFIAMFANILGSGVLMTTHSPYVLNVTNNLYYAGVLAAEGQSREVCRVMNKNFIIKKGELSAYKLVNIPGDDGKKGCINLLDEEGMEIKASLIDDVSAQINELYTSLYEIELDK